jgi:HlyD family secretion protein
MPSETKHEDLKSLRIDRSQRGFERQTVWSRRYIIIGVAVLVVLGLLTLAMRGGSAPEVDVAKAVAESGDTPPVILNAAGYIVAHHKISVNSKVTGRVAWIGVEKGDKVKEGQVLVRLEDDEFRAAAEQARGAMESARARLAELQHGSRPEEIAQAEHNLDEARATLVNDKANLDRIKPLVGQGVLARQQLDDAVARYDSSQQRVNSLEKVYQLAKIGPRAEQIQRAQGDLTQAEGQYAYAKSQLDATLIRAPVTGTILERTAEKGELVTAQFASGAEGGPRGSVVALADLNDLQVELDISQNDFARLGPKQRGIITTDAYPDKKYDGVIDEISPEANRQKATVQVKVKVLNPDELLRPDMNANVQFLSDSRPGTGSRGVVVPIAAVRDRDGKKFVYVVDGSNATEREVKVLEPRSAGYLVDGVQAGSTVVVNPPGAMKSGGRVKVKGK